MSEEKLKEIPKLAEIEQMMILHTYYSTGYNKTKTAKILGVSLRTIQYKLLSYGVESAKRQK